MLAWAKCYSLHTGVKTVRMVQNGIRTEGTVHLIKDGLRHCKGLKVFDLQDNLFTIKGANALAESISSWPELEEMGASDTLWGSKGIVKVCNALKKGQNQKLKLMRMQYDDINAKGLETLLVTVKSSLPVLQKLELNGNKFSEEDNNLLELKDILEERKEKMGGDVVVEDDWGLDELDELESDDEDESEEEEEEEEEVAEKLIEAQEEAQEEPTVQVKDKEVDDLADALAKKATV